MQHSFLSDPWHGAAFSFNLSSDGLSSLPLLHSNKLDADQYAVEDSHGVTESLFGSGNLSYASLQSAQTDAALHAQQALEHMREPAGNGGAYAPEHGAHGAAFAS